MIRVLHCLNSIDMGGAETFIMNIYRNINREKVQFDFLVRKRTHNKNIEEIKRLGGKIYVCSEFPKHFYRNYKEVKRFFDRHKEYDVIHVHANALIYIFPFIVAKKNNVKKRILHSHNTKAANKIYTPIHYLNRGLSDKYLTDRWACSDGAGKWMFGKRNYTVFNNAIDFRKYRFNEDVRVRKRNELGIRDELVIACVGRLEKQKNYFFMLQVMEKYIKLNKKCILLIIGDGSQKNIIAKEMRSKKINSSIKLLGKREDVKELLFAADIFAMPSLYEGLPFALIEAQASGLKCLISDKITDEAIITDNVCKLSIDNGVNPWVAELDRIKKKCQHTDEYTNICKSGFDIKKVSKTIEKMYLK